MRLAPKCKTAAPAAVRKILTENQGKTTFSQTKKTWSVPACPC
jgi:hypothetical protein